MPLYDADNPVSCELKVAEALADAFAASASFQELADLTGGSAEDDAREKIKLGLWPLPIDGKQFGRDELANDFLHCCIQRAEGGLVVISAGVPGAENEPTQQGGLEITVRRYVRESEEREDVFAFYWDRISKAAVEVAQWLDTTMAARLSNIRHAGGPYWSSDAQAIDQGRCVWSILAATWGDNLGGGE